MMREAKPDDEPRRAHRLWRVTLTASMLLAIVLLAASCSSGSAGPGVAALGSSSAPSASASPSGDINEQRLAYARCMREHGFPNLPDPQPGRGGFGPVLGELDPENPQVSAADEACGSALSQLGEKMDSPQAREQALAYARCMREHGFPNFPDPQPGGDLPDIDLGEHPELDPDNPQFQEANEACAGPERG